MKQSMINIALCIVLCLILPIQAMAATPGTYYSDDGLTKAVVSGDGNSMTVTYKNGATEEMDVSSSRGTVSIKTRNYADPNDAGFMGHIQICFMENREMTGAMILFGEPTPPASSITYASVPQWKADVINTATMSPRITGRDELDRLVADKLQTLIRPEWTNYQKLTAIYNYVVLGSPQLPVYDNSYDASSSNPPETALMSWNDTSYALYFLKNYGGVCDEYTAAFVALANAAGFEAYDMGGQLNGGSHAWALIRFGDTYYLFDPQAENINIRDNQIRYQNFCTESTITGSGSYVAKQDCFSEQQRYRQINKGDRYSGSPASGTGGSIFDAID